LGLEGLRDGKGKEVKTQEKENEWTTAK